MTFKECFADLTRDSANPFLHCVPAGTNCYVVRCLADSAAIADLSQLEGSSLAVHESFEAAETSWEPRSETTSLGCPLRAANPDH